jgi:hypothetical protein
MVKILALSVFVGNMLGSSFTTVSTVQKSPAHTPSDKFAIDAVYQTIQSKVNTNTGEFDVSYGSGFFARYGNKLTFVTAGHNCENVDSISVSRGDDLYEATIVFSGEPKVDLCLLNVSKRLKPKSVYGLATAPFKANTELISYGYAQAVRLVKLWHKTIEYATIPQINNKHVLIMRDPTYGGCSGGPVVNAATNNVAGVIVMTNREYAIATPTAEVIKAIDGLKKGEYR